MTQENHHLHHATQYISQLDDDWARVIEQVGACTLQPTAYVEPYEALVRAVAYQQLSTKAGDAIFAKFKMYFSGIIPAPATLINTTFDDLRACGFSGRKVETLLGIARGTLEGVVPSRTLADEMSNEALIAQLVQLKGIGQWTVEMMLMFTLGRMDVLPVDDLGVREGYKRLKSLSIGPTPKALAVLGQAWQPYRTIASWYLWRVPKA
ncbi:MAG: DNA-3-methyladenine glycosylase [Methylophilaceae bacterium 17-44-8]|jgi:DNA-3-methyladenine glycosylase II|nr:MAG: DNA-3-methyladenine glycosylase [Methylophilales bacterium 28-44-11]OYZ10329.1 MAG: DNA-3-methyladenine glycosylase [Methylophilales bacterium 16-45-7]OZA04679.1 MAG: DNA-3-methyladenine glycosylase [Methylophilaceae bacterium 17-44-8]